MSTVNGPKTKGDIFGVLFYLKNKKLKVYIKCKDVITGIDLID